MIAIIDYGMGNIHSVQKALESFGEKPLVTNRPEAIEDCSKIVLPGVGAFKDSLLELEAKGLTPAIKNHIKKKRFFLGICLGMQLLFEKSAESQGIKGLSLLKGQVRRFDERAGLKIPHIGWNRLESKRADCPLLKNLPVEPFVYFCHSYYPQCANHDDIAATTEYGADFASVVWRDNIFGLQFHPEKSQGTGLEILKNFVKL